MPFLRRALTWVVGTIAITSVGLLGANQLEDSFRRAFVCGRGVASITQRAAVDVVAYEGDNMTLARSIPMLATADLTQVVHEPYHRCDDMTIASDIVGVRSSFVIQLPPGADKCSVMTRMQSDLVSSGWSVHELAGSAIGGSAIDGGGYVHAMKAKRDHQQLDLSIDGTGNRLGVVADHDAPEDGHSTIGAPSMSCA